MNREVKKAWLEALQSGKYKQGVGRLRYKQPTGDEFCCLGVLCDISGLGEWKPTFDYTSYSYLGTSGTLPNRVLDWANLDWEMHSDLITMNDEGKTFHEIADYIDFNV